MSLIVYLDGRFLPDAEARVSVTDRGLLFGDGVYEVFRLYRGRPFRLQQHLARLRRSAHEIRLPLPELDWPGIASELLERNGLAQADATVYIEVTRGAPAGRGHAFPPAGTPPTLFLIARPLPPPDPRLDAEGVRVITRPDLRWGRCDIKSVNLLANVLASQEAADAGAWETVFVRDGVVTEGSHTNVFVVADGQLLTHPEGPCILSGITREAVLELARAGGLPVDETAVPVTTLARAAEVFLAGTSAEVLAVTRVDGGPVGDGRPGPVTRQLAGAFRALV